MKDNTITLPAFAGVVFSKAPGAVIGIGLFTLAAGILELFSLAALLPVLINLLGASTEAGIAGRIIQGLGLPELSFTAALTIVLLFMSVRGLFLFLADYWVAKVARNIEIDTRDKLYSSLIYANWQYLLSLDTGNIANLILREAEKYTRAILHLGRFFSSVLIASVLITSSLLVSWQAFMIFAAATIPYWAITKLINQKIKKNSNARVHEANRISSLISEDTPHLKYIKAGGLEKIVSHKFEQAIHAYSNYFLRITIYQRFIQLFPEVFGILILGALVLFSYHYVAKDPTDIIFFLLLMFRGYRQVAVVQIALSAVLEHIPSYKICEDFIEQASGQREKFEGGAIDHKFSRIDVKDIKFSYNKADIPALKKATLTIPSQGLIAFVGRSGAGKTTLGDIFLGLIRPQKGEILINNEVDLSNVNPQSWRQNIGYVPQDTFLISGNIRENILLGAEDQSDENLKNAAEKAHIHQFISDLPDGYETAIDNLGSRLSGGQKQRIALARALARNPGFLILDEATSALDSKTENEVKKTIEDIAKKIPVIVIAHRISFIKNAENIFVLEKGEVIESGTFTSLLERKGQFWSLFQATKGL